MKFLISTLALLVSSSALAADLELKAKSQQAIQQTGSFGGFYIGIEGGAFKTKSSFALPIGLNSGTVNPSGIVPGISLGYVLWANQSLALGIEGSASFDPSKTSNNCLLVVDCHVKSGMFYTGKAYIGIPLGAMTGAQQVVTATHRANLRGYAPETLSAANLMPFVSIGIAGRKTTTCIDSIGCDNKTPLGTMFGGGIMSPIASNWRLVSSLDFIRYNKTSPATDTLFPATFNAKSEYRFITQLQYFL